jgi:putative intracellular protease/amidase
MLRQTAVLVFDGFADWEPAFALTGLRRWGHRTVSVVGYDLGAVTSMGGLRVVPDSVIDDLSAETTEMLMLPGGDAWLDSYPALRLDPILSSLVDGRVPVAAICAATVALARAGCLRGRRHTSNGAAFLQHHASGYETQELYVETLAITDANVVTASGLGAIEFAREIFAALGVFGAADLQQYTDMYRHGRMPSEPG